MKTGEFLIAAHLRTEVLHAWIEAGWLMPEHGATDDSFSEIDVARAQLIRDLQGMGVNKEAVPIILDLIDQMHGLRRTIRALLSEFAAPAERAH
ncbi:MAG: chaperone modulatory protein CbpM [Hyphomicrobiales bacterium]|jgi:chaperone modulatory protein CbpM